MFKLPSFKSNKISAIISKILFEYIVHNNIYNHHAMS